MSQPLTREEHAAVLEQLQAMKRDVECPEGCDEGWVHTSGCGGHICGWPGHRETDWLKGEKDADHG